MLHTLQSKMLFEFGIHLFAKTFVYNIIAKVNWIDWIVLVPLVP